ncbi:MAG: Hsp33 family molecular chaperone HslO [Alphaproteobacteria bacterium]|nr:Hsp33 family molecular chaperone HslO [Alphaproteobacteria bacterium]
MATDIITPFYLGKAQVRGKLVRLGDQLDHILKSHSYPPIVNQYLSELIAIGIALSINTKNDGLFTLQISNGKILRMMVVDITSEGEIRGCAKWDHEALEKLLIETNNSPSLTQLFENGFLVFTADLASQTERYQAVVKLSGSTLSDCMHHFFRQSDQLATGLVVATKSNPSMEGYSAAALILQKLPSSSEQTEIEDEQDDDDWITDLSLLGTVTKKELLDPNLSANTLLYRLFHERQVHILPAKDIVAKCYCSRPRIEQILMNFTEADIKNMILDNQISVTCEFCNETYLFDDLQISEILADKKL